MIQTAGNSRLEAMFGPPVDGFRWVSLAISGSANSPTDNFKDLYDAAAASPAPAAPDGGIPSFEDLTRPE